MKTIVYAAAIVGALALSGCVTTRTTDIAPNVVRLDTEAGGLLFQGQAAPETMRKAAEATVARGYKYFKFADVSTGQSRELAGIYSSGQAQVYGGYNSVSIYGNRTSTPIYRPTENVGVTVVMSNTKDASSWDAAEILARPK